MSPPIWLKSPEVGNKIGCGLAEPTRPDHGGLHGPAEGMWVSSQGCQEDCGRGGQHDPICGCRRLLRLLGGQQTRGARVGPEVIFLQPRNQGGLCRNASGEGPRDRDPGIHFGGSVCGVGGGSMM